MAEEQAEFRIYNSMSQQKEIFKTKVPGKVSMYVCGVTAYDFSHLGHARAAVSFDILFRYDEVRNLAQGFKVYSDASISAFK